LGQSPMRFHFVLPKYVTSFRFIHNKHTTEREKRKADMEEKSISAFVRFYGQMPLTTLLGRSSFRMRRAFSHMVRWALAKEPPELPPRWEL